jgi:hypothetical protein
MLPYRHFLSFVSTVKFEEHYRRRQRLAFGTLARSLQGNLLVLYLLQRGLLLIVVIATVEIWDIEYSDFTRHRSRNVEEGRPQCGRFGH